MFKPELISSLRTYNLKTFFADLSAGIIVGVVALPLAIAFGIASGVKPEQGIFTAIVAGFLISALGGSKVQIGGPTGAFVVIVYSVVQQYGYSGLAIATIMAGVMLILLGILKLGGLISFIPYTIITGFTAGIAVTIFTTQIGDFLGLAVPGMPGDFLGKIKVYAKAIGTIDIYTSIVAAVSLAAIFIWPRFNKKIPGSLIVIVLSTIVCIVLKKAFGLELATIGSRYGEIPKGLPLPKLPSFSGADIKELFPVSVSIAMLAAIESLLSAVVADGMTGTKHNSNTELIAQGIANIASPIFGGIPATGAIARTATNIKNGGRTPVAGIIHAITLLLITFFLGRYVVYIPMAALAAVLVSVSWNMAGIPAVRELLKGQKSDSAVLFITFFLTVFIDLTVAIGAGLLFAAFFFIKKMVDVSTVREYGDISDGLISESEGEKPLNVPDGILVYEVLGPLFFGTVRKFEIAVERAGVEYKVLILRLRHTNYLDAGGIMVLTQLKNACDKKGIKIVLAGVHPQPLKLLTKTGMAEKIGTENIFDNFAGALKHAVKIRD
ncbi:sulfate permease [Treponema parvum]|uniref:Sulfate permease n=1 Tax=Treponema parvum TaxID=138851 RepID=A0A975F0Y7_9SPIR|nr:sulfate permease [Treponema parvum]QTQ12469.1 sulfate permease [Treponema parvum]